MTPIGNNRIFYDDDLDFITLDWLDDSVVRVENCHDKVCEQDLLHVFSRYDLKAPSVLRWTGDRSLDTKKAPSVFLVRFADAAWARAALREKQSYLLYENSIRLVQFPKQLIAGHEKQPKLPVYPTQTDDYHSREEKEQQTIAVGQ